MMYFNLILSVIMAGIAIHETKINAPRFWVYSSIFISAANFASFMAQYVNQTP